MLITCSSCQSKIRVPEAAAGKKGKCPKCGTIIVIPTLEEAAAEEAAAEAAPPLAAGGPSFDFASEPPPKRRPRDDDEEEAAADADEDRLDDEGEDRPRKKPRSQESIGLSLTSLILGGTGLLSGTVCGCCCGVFQSPLTFLLAVAALVCGFLGMKKGGKVLAIIGMSLGGAAMIASVIWLILGIVYLASGTLTQQFQQMQQMQQFKGFKR